MEFGKTKVESRNEGLEDKEKINEQEGVKNGQPPGFEFVTNPQFKNAEEVEEPLPGFQPVYKETINKQEGVKDGPPPVPNFTFLAHTLPKLPSSFPESGQREVRSRIKRPTIQSASTQQMPQPAPQPEQPVATSSASELEIAQLVCGTCGILCTYPRGEKLIQCPSCMELNHVMEAHEIGQVVCNLCSTLLMYQYGALAVCCSSCNMVTDIGERNRRAPLGEQQSQRRRRVNRRR